MTLAFKTLKEISEEIGSGKTTSREAWEYFLKRIEKYEVKIQAFNFLNKD